MPVPLIKSLAKKHGLPPSVVERYWAECKASVDENAANRWARVAACVKSRCGKFGRKRKANK